MRIVTTEGVMGISHKGNCRGSKLQGAAEPAVMAEAVIVGIGVAWREEITRCGTQPGQTCQWVEAQHPEQ